MPRLTRRKPGNASTIVYRRLFEVWLAERGLVSATVRSRVRNCERVEEFEGDLDAEFDRDRLDGVIARLSHSTEDARSGRKPGHGIPIGGDVVAGTATLKSAVNLYRRYRLDDDGGDPDAGTARRSAPRGTEDWPTWAQPDDGTLLALGRALAPLVRFLDPAIVSAVVEDNRRLSCEWGSRFDEIGLDAGVYLWDGSPCAFPGIRRYVGKERDGFRQRTPDDCLALDDNDCPKHLWCFALTGKPFRTRGPAGYRLAHLLDHQEYPNRWRDELDGPDLVAGTPKLFGLYASAANAAYVPKAYLHPTDASSKLRRVMQGRALALYGDVCRLVPPLLGIKLGDDPAWDEDEFPWSAPVGDLGHVDAFLEFRRNEIEDLFARRG